MGLRSPFGRFVGAIAASGILIVGCGDGLGTGPSRNRFDTFTLSGIIRAHSSSQPLAGVTVTAKALGADNLPMTVTVTTSADGRYVVDGLRDYVVLKTTQDGFYPSTTTFVLEANKALDLLLESAPPLATEGSDLAVGKTVHGTLGPSDVRCDPQWDRNSPCRHFGFTAPASRTFEISLRFPVCPPLELHVFNPGGQRIAYESTTTQFEIKPALLEGVGYQIRVMAYYSCDWFEITVK